MYKSKKLLQRVHCQLTLMLLCVIPAYLMLFVYIMLVSFELFILPLNFALLFIQCFLFHCFVFELLTLVYFNQCYASCTVLFSQMAFIIPCSDSVFNERAMYSLEK